jgi:SAM-dependent methyltransferase
MATATTAPELTPEQVMDLDPYSFLAVLGKKVVRPGGHRSTEELFALANLTSADRVLDIGCGVGATGIEIINRFGSHVTLSDKSELMLAQARANVAAAGMQDRIDVDWGDIVDLPYPDDTFDVTMIEAVTMFVDRERAIREAVRVTKPGGRILDHEFCWRGRPNLEALEILRQPMMCPGINFDDVRNWGMLFERHGVKDIESVVGPFALMMPRQFVRDEGPRNSARIVGRIVSRRVYMRKSIWLMKNIASIMPKLGYIVLKGTKA